MSVVRALDAAATLAAGPPPPAQSKVVETHTAALRRLCLRPARAVGGCLLDLVVYAVAEEGFRD